MTTPPERFNSMRRTRRFLFDLLDPSAMPGVSRRVRLVASACLKHYPCDLDVDRWEQLECVEGGCRRAFADAREGMELVPIEREGEGL